MLAKKPKVNRRVISQMPFKINRRQAGLCIECGESKDRTDRTCCAKCRERQKQVHAEKLVAYKKQVYDHYGWICKCCGETREIFLTIEHKHGWRNMHGTPHRLGGEGTYRWIIDNSFPESIEILCLNCNFAKGRLGYCPHEVEAKNFCGLLPNLSIKSEGEEEVVSHGTVI